MTSVIIEPSRETPVIREADVVVCGGGPAGISAAMAAADAGANTVMLEVAGCLGGIWTAGLLTYILDPKPESPVTALLISELEKRGAKSENRRLENLKDKFAWAKNSFIYDPEAMKLILEQQCVARGIHVQLHTRVCAVSKPPESGGGRSIASVLTESVSGRQAWKAKIFIDATGNGDVAAEAGCRFELGRPGSGETQPMTLMFLFTTPHPDLLAPFVWGEGASLREELKSRGIRTTYGAPILFEIQRGLFAFMMNHHYGTGIDAAEGTRATFEARQEIHDTMDALRSHGGIWEGSRVVATAEQIGIREGRRIRGLYEITVDDLIAGRRQSDGICQVSFPVDVHSTRKEAGEAFDPENKIQSQAYDIPLRSLIAADADNLLLAGRCISGDFLAHSSYRVTGNAVATGEAAGCLAAAAAADGTIPANISWERFRKTADRLSGCS